MVTWTSHALAQLRHLHDYISSDSPLYAKRVVENVVKKVQILNEAPRLGRIVPELNDHNVRELSIYSYRIIYDISSTQAQILAVIHKRRDMHPDEIQLSE